MPKDIFQVMISAFFRKFQSETALTRAKFTYSKQVKRSAMSGEGESIFDLLGNKQKSKDGPYDKVLLIFQTGVRFWDTWRLNLFSARETHEWSICSKDRRENSQREFIEQSEIRMCLDT